MPNYGTGGTLQLTISVDGWLESTTNILAFKSTLINK